MADGRVEAASPRPRQTDWTLGQGEAAHLFARGAVSEHRLNQLSPQREREISCMATWSTIIIYKLLHSLSLFIIELCILLCRIVLYVLCLYIYHCIEFCGVIIVF